MRILVVEDERSLGAFLKIGLEREGHCVQFEADGESALQRIATWHPELVLLDLSLPKRDGLEVLAEMRARHDDASVLVLTGRSDADVQVQCLDLGADDCMIKPFSFQELAARCRALIRRREQIANAVLRHCDVELHRISHRVLRGGQTIDLTAKEFSLLEALMLHRGECVGRSQLLTEVWQMSPEAVTNVVDVYITYLRRKLNAGGNACDANSGLIRTVRGMGYSLCDAGCNLSMHKPVKREVMGRVPVVAEAAYA